MIEIVMDLCAWGACYMHGNVLQVSAPWVYPHPENWVMVLDGGIRLVFVPCAGGA